MADGVTLELAKNAQNLTGSEKLNQLTAVVTIGHTQYRVTGDPVLAAGVRVAGMAATEAAVALVKALLAKNNALKVRYQDVPRVARPGATLQHDNNQYGNRPVIRVMTREVTDLKGQLSPDGALVVGTFDDWILADVQESDSEKVDVVETFGAPHLFVSGRFIRKYTFSGIVRATPVNAWAEGNSGTMKSDAEMVWLRTTQFDLLRVFYDKYLRATEQAARGTYTEIIVDGQSYVGYIGTMNFHRAAETDQTVPFTFTMYGIDRRGAGDSDANTALAPFDRKARKGVQLNAAQAAAELSAAHGEVTLQVTGTINLGEVTPDEPNGKPTAARPTVTLVATGVTQRVKVTGPRGMRLLYRKVGSAAAVPVDNTAVPIGTEEITAEITDYFLFYQAMVQKTPDAEAHAVTARFTMKADCGATQDVLVSVTLKGQSKAVLAGLSGLLNNVALSGSLAGTEAKTVQTLGVLSNDVAFTPENTVPVELKIKLAYPDKTPLPTELLTQTVISAFSVAGEPALGTALAPSTHPRDAGKVAATQTPAVTSSVANGMLSVRFTLATLVAPAEHRLDDKTYSPLIFGDRLKFTVKGLTLTAPGLAPVTIPDVAVAVSVPTPKGRSLFLGMQLYAPSDIQSLKNGGKSVTFTFSFSRAEGVTDPLDGSVLEAIKAMTFNLAVSLPGWWGANDTGMAIPLRAPSAQSIEGKVPVTATPTVWVVDSTVNVQVVFATAREPEDMLTFIHFAKALADPKKVALAPPAGSPIRAPYAYVKIQA